VGQRLTLQAIDTPAALTAAQVLLSTAQGPEAIEGSEVAEHLFGGLGDQRIRARSGEDTVFGEGGNDRIDGGVGLDVLFGGDGNDTLIGGTGNDTFTGGTGADVFAAPASGGTTDVILDFQAAEGDRIDLRHLGISEFATVQRLLFDLGASTELRHQMGSTLQGVVLQGLADPAALTAAQFILATEPGPDEIGGMDAAEHLFGGLGGQRITSAQGDDTVFGEAGDDYLDASFGRDLLFGGDGNDTLVGGAGNDTMTGGTGADLFVATSRPELGADISVVTDFSVAQGDRIDLRLLGISDYATVQTLLVDAGAATYLRHFAVGAEQRLMLNDVADPTALTAASFVFSVAENNDVISGTAANAHLFGGRGDDRISGFGGNDTLHGEAGADTLIGGSGRDVLFGGADSARDIFVFNAPSESILGIATRDVVRDFVSGIDGIWLAGMDANTVVAGNQAFAFSAGPAAHSVWLVRAGAGFVLRGDVNGSGADFEIQIANIASMTAGDIVL
jgi:serralysin